MEIPGQQNQLESNSISEAGIHVDRHVVCQD